MPTMQELEERWASLGEAAVQLSDAARAAPLERKRLRSATATVRAQLQERAKATWPRRIATRPLGRGRTGLTIWHSGAETMRARYLRETQGDVRQLQHRFEARLGRYTKTNRRALEARIALVRKTFQDTVRALKGAEEDVRIVFHTLAEGRACVAWLLDLPLIDLRYPSGWLQPHIAALRGKTSFATSRRRQVRKGVQHYEAAWRWLSLHPLVLPVDALHRIAIERLKLRCYLALVPLRRAALVRVVDEVIALIDHQDCALPAMLQLDAAEMLALAALKADHRFVHAQALALYEQALPLLNDELRPRAQQRLQEIRTYAT